MDISWWSVLGAVVVCWLIYGYFKIKKAWSYFSNNKIPYLKPFYDFKGTLNVILRRQTPESIYQKMYNEPSLKDAKIFGIYMGLEPSYVVKDPSVIEQILIKDFTHFHDHNTEVDTETDPLNSNLFNLNGNNWKAMRTKLSPIFTTGKIKWMFDQIIKSSDNLIEYFEKLDTGEDVEFKSCLNSYGMDVIASCAFGIETNTFKNPDLKFIQMAEKLLKPSFGLIIKSIGSALMPKVFKYFKIKLLPKDIDDFFLNLTKDTMNYRIKNNVQRNDFIQLLIQLKQQGYVEPDVDRNEKIENYTTDSKFEYSDEVLAAQVFIFFIAGFDSTATTISYTLLYLAENPEIQDRVRKEIISCVEKEGVTYDSLKNMTYLECCLSETLRLNSAIFLLRVCTKDYQYENITIKKGNQVIIPVHAIHRDEQYYENAKKYVPDRFIDSKSSVIQSSSTYFPFGNGPRVCIARRFVLVQAKVALVKILLNFEIIKSSKIIDLLDRDPAAVGVEPRGGMWIKVKKIKKH